LWESGDIVSKRSVVDLVNEDPEESGGLVIWIGLELRTDIEDKGRGDSGE
jgi:hypothetical protein